VRIRGVLLERCLARLAVCSAGVLFATVRKQFHFAESNTSPYIPVTDATFVYSVWHDSLLMPLFLGRQRSTMALVGLHNDGTFLAGSLRALGISCVRGSSSRGGSQAVHQLLKTTAGHHIVVTPDGPRGPRREMKAGIAYIASRTGKPVVPTAFACRSGWSVGRGWTDLRIPKPGTTVFALTGRAMYVPADADTPALDEYTRLIQSEMDQLNARAAALALQAEGALSRK
jgi:hypothetical protein